MNLDTSGLEKTENQPAEPSAVHEAAHGTHKVPAGAPHPLGKQIAISVVILAALALTGFTLTKIEKPKNAEAAPATDPNSVVVSDAGKGIVGLSTSTVREETVQSDLHLTGLISYPSDQTVSISPRLQGRIRQVMVHVGDRVTAGQVLAVLESVDAANAQTAALQSANKLRQAKLDLDRQERLYALGTPDVTTAQAAYDQASAAADAAKDVLTTTTEQDKIGGFTQKPLEDATNARIAADATLAQAQSDLQQAQRDYDRKQKLVQVGVAAQADLDQALNTLEKAKVNVESSAESAKLAKEAVERERKAFGSNLYSKQQIESASNAYRQALVQKAAASRALQLAKSQIHRDLEQARSDYQSATLDAANSQRALTLLGHPNSDGSFNVTAPISGIVTALNVSAGQAVDQSQMTPWQMLTISNPSKVWVDADVYEKDIASVAPGAKATIRVAALANKEFSGTVLRIAPTVDKTSRSIKLRSVIDNPSGLLKDGEYAEVSVTAGRPHEALLIPLTAVDHEGDDDFAFVESNGKYLKTKIEVGAPTGESVEVHSGLKAGDKIVTKGAIFLGSQSGDN